MKKVYCDNCRWFEAGYWEEPEEKCIVGKKKYATNYASRKIRGWKPTTVPSQQNHDNHCPDYKRQWWRIWI